MEPMKSLDSFENSKKTRSRKNKLTKKARSGKNSMWKNLRKKQKREMAMKHCFWQVNEISWRLHQLKSKGAPHGTYEKS